MGDVCGSKVAPSQLLRIEVVGLENALPSFSIPQSILTVNADSWCIQDVAPVAGVDGDFWSGTAAADPAAPPPCSSLRHTSDPYYHERVGFARQVLAGGDAAVTASAGLDRLVSATVAEAPCATPPCVAQAVSFTVTPVAGNATWLFTRPPRVDVDGTLIFALRPGAYGNATFALSLADDGRLPLSSLGARVPLPAKSSNRTFTIAVLFVNQPPYFDLGALLVTAPPWRPRVVFPLVAVNISTGPPPEAAVVVCCSECRGPASALYSCCGTCSLVNCTGLVSGGGPCRPGSAQQPVFDVGVVSQSAGPSADMSALFASGGLPYVLARDGALVLALATPPLADVNLTLVVTLRDTGPAQAAMVPGLMDPLPSQTLGRRDVWQRNLTLIVSGTGRGEIGRVGRDWSAAGLEWEGNESLPARWGHAVVEFGGWVWPGGSWVASHRLPAPWRGGG